jgi:putative ABC transport system permease protein
MPGRVEQSGVRGASGSAANLTYEDALAIADPRNVPDARFVAPTYGRNTQVIFGAANVNAAVTGVTAEYLAAFNLKVTRGCFIEAGDVDKRASVAVLGHQAAQDLFGGFDPIGQKIKVSLPGNAGRVSLTVVGVLEEKGGSMMNNADDTVFVPISTAQTRLFSGRNPQGALIVSQVNVVAVSEDRTPRSRIRSARCYAGATAWPPMKRRISA